MESGHARLTQLRALFTRHDDPYAGADLERARLLGAALWLIGAAIAVALLPFSHPTSVLGGVIGWAGAALLVAVCLAGAARVRRPDVGFDHLLVACYLGIAQVALLVWLAGGAAAPYDQLYLLCFMYAAAVHPPRRAAPCIAFASAAFLAPLAYGGFAAGALASSMTQLLIWWGLSLVALALMASVRAQRVEGLSASRLARVDPVTGLGNRRAFEEALGRESARAARTGDPLALILLDLDDFKEINDRHGHPAGDRCLRRVADVLRLTIRAGDLGFRWGGDEFAVVLPQATVEAARGLAARLGSAVREAPAGPADPPLRVSCGVAGAQGRPLADDLVAEADMDLYIAKRGPAAVRRPAA